MSIFVPRIGSARFYSSIVANIASRVLFVFGVLPLVAHSQTLGTPPNIVDAYNAANQVGYCIDSGGSGSCTANDFLITSIDILNIDDGCTGADDYMQVDAEVFFNKATPARYDITAWFFRGDDQATLPNPDFIAQNARIGDFCTRVSLESGLAISSSTQTSGLIDPDSCADVPNTPNGDLQQTVANLVLPCRDIGTPDPSDPQGPLLSSTPDGIIDISGCTSWDNNQGTTCDGPEYDGVNEPVAGTGSKCNCGEFAGITLQVGLPEISVTKSCSPTQLQPGETTNCTINIVNSGTGAQVGATAAGVEGFFYEDDYPEVYGSVSNIATTQGAAVDGFTVDATGASTTNQSLNIYPGDIPGGTTVTITYDFVTSSSLPQTVTTITNTVCASYLDEGTDGSTEVFSYAFDADLCDTQIVTTPVTLAGFYAQSDAGGVAFSWKTATETNNMGFNIYARRGHTLFKVNDEIVPSQSVSTLDESFYSLWLDVERDLIGAEFYLEDIDIQGKATKHGPFRLNQGEKITRSELQRTDWGAIKRGNAKSKLDKQSKNKLAKTAKQTSSDAGQTVVNVEVVSPGVQRISFADLSATGFDTRLIRQGRYRLTDRTGNEVASRVDKRAGFIEFLADTQRTFYSDRTVYQIRASNQQNSALQMETVRRSRSSNAETSPFYMHTETLERDEIYVNSSRAEDDPWMMHRLFAIRNPASTSFDVPVSNVYAGDVVSLVSAQLAGGINVPEQLDRSVEIAVGGQTLDSGEYDGTVLSNLSGVTLLPTDSQSVTVTVSTTPLNSYNVDITYTNRVSVQYPRRHVAIDNKLSFESSDSAFAISGLEGDLAHVYASTKGAVYYLGDYSIDDGSVRFDGVSLDAQYHIVARSSLGTPALTAVTLPDFSQLDAPNLVIAHPEFMGVELDDYLNARSGLGRGASQAVSTESIYAAFSGGVRDANAIHDFIRSYAAGNQLESIMLVGGDVYDYHDNLKIGAVSFLPTLYRPTGDLIQFSPVDALFGDIDYDDVQDIPLGRLPVRTVEELSTLVGKMETFANQRGQRSAVLVADEQGSNSAYNFTGSSESVAEILEPDGWQVQRAYIDLLGAAGARAQLLDGFNQGPRLALYTGHSSPSSWSGKQIFTYQDTLGLTNIGSPGVYVQWGCYNTYFSSPTADSMSHGLMLAGQQGAAAVIGSSTLTDANAESEFAILVQNEMIESQLSFGESLVEAKRKFYRDTGLTYRGILWGVALLGDPLLSL